MVWLMRIASNRVLVMLLNWHDWGVLGGILLYFIFFSAKIILYIYIYIYNLEYQRY